MSVPPLYRCFASQVAAVPDAVALDGPAGRLTYAELERRADDLVRLLRSHGVGTGRIVGLCLPRSPDLVAAMLGVVKLGAAYLPLDPRHPAKRLRQILDQAGCVEVVADAAHADAVPAGRIQLLLEQGRAVDDGAEPREEPGSAEPDDLVCVFYTSGSTGQPKGVAVMHRNVLNLLEGLDFLELGPGDRVAHLSNPAFDAVTFEIWAPLTTGAAAVVVPQQATSDVAMLLRLVEAHDISTAFLTTALFRAAAVRDPSCFDGMRHVLFGGEAADAPSVASVVRAGMPDRLFNVYGPTETTTFATAFEVPATWDSESSSIPIGVPLAGVRACLLDRDLRPVPAGVVGELYLGGASVARGYLGEPALTAERFAPDPSSEWPGQRLYRTGDLARSTSAGILEFVGRADDQVKIRGNRVELAEVEAALAAHPGIAEAAAAVWEPEPGDRRLVACVVSPDGTDLDAVRGAVRERLPDFMVPAHLVRCDALPLNANGKVHREAVLALAVAGLPVSRRPPAGDGYLELVTAAWEEILRHEVGPHDNFFDAGGNSLLLLQVHARLEQQLGHEVALLDVLEFPTVSGLAAHLQTLHGDRIGVASPELL